jgi:heparanase
MARPVYRTAALATLIFMIGSSGVAQQLDVPRSTVPSAMPRIGTIDQRYQAYNIEMVEVTGGKFWKPYSSPWSSMQPESGADGGHPPAGIDSNLFEYRPPINLSSRRLRVLAAALGPAYLRVSGTWANSTYLESSDEHLTQPPEGFSHLLTQEQWKGVVEFSRAVNAPIVTSFATSSGTRDPGGIWKSLLGLRVLEYTRLLGGTIAAAEFMNEPTLALMGGAPKGYDAEAYGKDFRVFHTFARDKAPEMLILGPGSVGETVAADTQLSNGSAGFIMTRDMLRAGGNDVDAFSYHHYGAVSQRCTGVPSSKAQSALSEDWLARTDETLTFYRGLRDEFAAGKPLWVTETAESACGGNPWASSFLDTFRYLDQLGRLAKGGVQVVMHNTLAASDYALLDNHTYDPRPNYWAALLWRRLMGTTVLESGIPIEPGLHVYAHCMRDTIGGVTLLVINTSQNGSKSLVIPVEGQRYTLSSVQLADRAVRLNGIDLQLGIDDTLPPLPWTNNASGTTDFAPATITFIAVPAANNTACQATE